MADTKSSLQIGKGEHDNEMGWYYLFKPDPSAGLMEEIDPQ